MTPTRGSRRRGGERGRAAMDRPGNPRHPGVALYAAAARRRAACDQPDRLRPLNRLKHARFWFSQLTLIHALCLWEMPEPNGQDPGRAGAQSTGEDDSKQPAHQPRWIEQRLKRTDRGDLPPCLTTNRKSLHTEP